MSFGSLPSVLGNGGGVAISVIGGRGLFADGTAAAPSISFASDTNTGFYSNAADSIGISVNGARQFRFEATGRLYGGTVNNFLGLDSSGAVSIGAAGTNQNITLTPSGTGSAVVSAAGTSDTNGALNVTASIDANFTWIQTCMAPNITAGRVAVSFLGKAASTNNSGYMGFLWNSNSSATNGLTWGLYAADRLMTLLGNGRLLLGTATDSGALLQIGTNTTANTGGMVFGTDTFLYRLQAATLAFDATNPAFYIRDAGQTVGRFSSAAGITYIDALNASNTGSLVFRTGNGGGTALTLSSTQAATFAGNVTVTGGQVIGPAGTTGLQVYPSSLTGFGALYGDANATTGVTSYGSSHATKANKLEITAPAGTTLVGTGNNLTVSGTGTSTFAGALTVGGALKLANAYVAGAVVGTGYVTIQDSTGTTYRVPVLV